MGIIQATSDRGYEEVIFLGQDSLGQSGVREAARYVGVAMVAIEARDPIEAQQRILRTYDLYWCIDPGGGGGLAGCRGVQLHLQQGVGQHACLLG